MTRHMHVNGNGIAGNEKQCILIPEIADLNWNDAGNLAEHVSERNDAVAEKPQDGVALFGLLPFPSLDGSMKELRRIYGSLKLDGVCIVPIAGERFIDEEHYLPLLKELNTRGVRLMLHPADTHGEPLVNVQYLDAVLALSRLLYYDRLKVMRNVELIIAHSAGVEDFLADNIGMLYYLQHQKMRIASFLFDYMRGRRLKGEEYVRNVQTSEEQSGPFGHLD